MKTNRYLSHEFSTICQFLSKINTDMKLHILIKIIKFNQEHFIDVKTIMICDSKNI